MLEEVAKTWKQSGGPVIVDDGAMLKGILKTLESCMSGGRIGQAKSASGLSRQTSFAFANDSAVDLSDSGKRPSLGEHNSSYGMSGLHVEETDEEEHNTDPRAWLKVISAFEQPRLTYDIDKKHYERISKKPSLFPLPSHKTAMFRERYNIIHQRLLRNEAFQAPSFNQRSSTSLARSSSTTMSEYYKITPIANLLGRGGSNHLLLGLLVIAPTGTLALNDLSGSISLDLQHAKPLQGEHSAYFCPGMIVLVDGVYEEDYAGAGSGTLGSAGGVGGTIGGRFIGFSIGCPPVEKRNASLGVNLVGEDVSAGGGFGWTDFLGQGSERAVGGKMRRLEQRFVGPESPQGGAGKMVVLGEVNLDDPITLEALRKVLATYANSDSSPEVPMTFVLTGNFASTAAMAGASAGSIEYKEYFNELAAALADYPALLRSSTWVFVPGDNDPWASAFSAGASTAVPRESLPDVFTSRIKRAFATAKAEVGVVKRDGVDGETVWTSNPARLSLFGPAHEVVVFRDDISGRLRRNAVRFSRAATDAVTDSAPGADIDVDVVMSGGLADEDSQATEAMDTTELSAARDPTPSTAQTADYTTAQAKKLILSILPQSTLSPFPLGVRPVHWDYASSLSLYPLPHTLILADAEAAPFAMTYEGCHVINPGRLVSGGGKRKRIGWCEYNVWTKRGDVKEMWM